MVFGHLKWQADEFIKVMKFGTMKSMGYPNPRIETEPFKNNGYQYQFIILNDWGPCYLKNMDTGKEREIIYHHLQSSKVVVPYEEKTYKPVEIKKIKG